MNLKKLLKNNKLLIFVAIAVVLFITIALLNTRQDLRQRAGGGQIITSLTFSPGAVDTWINNQPTNISVQAIDQSGEPISDGVTYDWGISSTNSIGRLVSISGSIATFEPMNVGTGDIYVTAINSNGSITASTFVKVASNSQTDSNITSIVFQPRSISTIAGSKPTNISVLAYDQNRQPILNGVTYEWGISSTNSIGKLSSVAGSIATFVPLKPGVGDIYVTATNLRGKLTSSMLATVTGKPGDVNNDSQVGIQDLSIMLSNWQSTTFSNADFNNDGFVNITDLSILLSNWGK